MLRELREMAAAFSGAKTVVSPAFTPAAAPAAASPAAVSAAAAAPPSLEEQRGILRAACVAWCPLPVSSGLDQTLAHAAALVVDLGRLGPRAEAQALLPRFDRVLEALVRPVSGQSLLLDPGGYEGAAVA